MSSFYFVADGRIAATGRMAVIAAAEKAHGRNLGPDFLDRATAAQMAAVGIYGETLIGHGDTNGAIFTRAVAGDPVWDADTGRVIRRVTVEDSPLSEAKATLKVLLADARWRHETGGIAFQGQRIATDRQSQGKIAALSAHARSLRGTVTAHWKTASGAFLALDRGGVLALGRAVSVHVQACYDWEAARVATIERASNVAALRAVDIA